MKTNQPSSSSFERAEQEVAAGAVVRTLEQTCFLIPEAARDAADAPEEAVAVTLAFGGPRPGVLEVATDLRLGRVLAANMLGCDETDDEAVAAAEDGLQETVNIAAGAMMPDFAAAIDAVAADYPLDLPATRRVDHDDWKHLSQHRGSIRFNVDGIPLLVHLRAA